MCRTVGVSQTTCRWFVAVQVLVYILILSDSPLVAHGLVETRVDPFGGTGLYATAAIAQGQDVYHCSGLDEIVYCSLDDNDDSPIATCVKSFCIGKNSFTESVSIGASLASWKLFQDCGLPNTNTQAAWKQAGISQATSNHAANLPWDKAKWQLPVVWPPQVLQSALAYGYDQVVLEQQEADTSLSLSQLQILKDELQEACESAKSRVSNFQLAAVRLAEELEPTLKTHCRMMESTTFSQQVHMACHQAMAMIFSQSFLHPQTGEMTMLPIIDSANHNVRPNCSLKNHVETKGVKLVANHDIHVGDEITITYNLESMAGDNDKAISFAGYGFVPLGVAQQSPAGRALHLAAIKGQEMARELLQQHEQESSISS